MLNVTVAHIHTASLCPLGVTEAHPSSFPGDLGRLPCSIHHSDVHTLYPNALDSHPPYAVIIPAGDAAVQEWAARWRARRCGRWAWRLQPAGRMGQTMPEPAEQSDQCLRGKGGSEIKPCDKNHSTWRLR